MYTQCVTSRGCRIILPPPPAQGPGSQLGEPGQDILLSVAEFLRHDLEQKSIGIQLTCLCEGIWIISPNTEGAFHHQNRPPLCGESFDMFCPVWGRLLNDAGIRSAGQCEIVKGAAEVPRLMFWPHSVCSQIFLSRFVRIELSELSGCSWSCIVLSLLNGRGGAGAAGSCGRHCEARPRRCRCCQGCPVLKHCLPQI